MKQYASSPRKDKSGIREIRGEKLQGIEEGASSAPRLASSSAASFPGRNESPGTHCSLIEQEDKEDSSCLICHRVWDKRKDGEQDRVARTERESDNRRREEKWPTCWCCRDQQRACRMAQAKAEIQHKALRRGKNLAFSKNTCLEKERVRSKATPRKVGVELKRRRELSMRRLGRRLAWWGSTKKKKVLHFLGLRGRHQYSDQCSNRIRAPCVASTVVGTEEEEDQMAKLSA